MSKTDILLTSINSFYNEEDNRSKLLNILDKSSLDGYSKKLFDPFCRSEKFAYKVPGTSHEIHTTLAQLNFIKWCIKNKIIDYISSNKNTLFSKQSVVPDHHQK